MKPSLTTTVAFAALLVGMACSDDAPTGTVFPSTDFAPIPGVTGVASAPSLSPVPGSPALGGAFVDNPARVMVTGTLAVTSDDEFAVAADSERDELVRVELGTRLATRVPLTVGDEPGRTVVGKVDEDGAHTYTVLRGAAAVADFNIATGKVKRVPTCQAPRGVAYEAGPNLVHVACATSELVSFDADTWESVRHIAVARDLRDVVVTERGLVVSRFASAELLRVDAAGEVSLIGEPRVPPACTEPTVMFRLVSQGGYLHAAHQLATTDVVLGRAGRNECAVEQTASAYWRAPISEVLDLAGAAPAGSDAGAADDDRGYWAQFVTATDQVPARDESWLRDQDVHHLALLGKSVGPMDLAVHAGGRVVASVAGNFWQEGAPTILTWDHDDALDEARLSAFRVAGMVTSVAFDGQAKWIAQSREPAGLYFEDGEVLFFGGRSVNNTSHSLFHMNSGAGVACASCHPEGGQDEHVWRFPRGLRRTLPLGPTALGGPYDWDARNFDIQQLLSRVLNQQMSHDFVPTWQQSDAFGAWLGQLPPPSPGVISNIGAVGRGRAAFSDAGCAACHTGATYTDRATHDVGTGDAFETPSLLGVGGRSRLLHDGCAATLRDVLGACGGDSTHQVLERLSLQQVNDLMAFLSTL